MIYRWRGTGDSWNTRPGKYGHIAKCPHCDAVNIERTHGHQITCGKIPCREEQNRKMKRASQERARAKKAREEKR